MVFGKWPLIDIQRDSCQQFDQFYYTLSRSLNKVYIYSRHQAFPQILKLINKDILIICKRCKFETFKHALSAISESQTAANVVTLKKWVEQRSAFLAHLCKICCWFNICWLTSVRNKTWRDKCSTILWMIFHLYDSKLVLLSFICKYWFNWACVILIVFKWEVYI